MRNFASIPAMRRQAQAWRTEGLTIALVPTMGALHEGHAALIRTARRQADKVVASVFVNPIQFGPREDFVRYPRDMKTDRHLCRAWGVDAVFAPAARAMYANDHSVFVEETALRRTLCGRTRPGHFRGVATVVLKLFNIVAPHTAVFGQKDFQQVAVVQRLVRDLNVPVAIVAVPTVREKDGLAISSRNARLTSEQRRIAPCLWAALQAARRLCRAKPRSSAAVGKTIRKIIRAQGAYSAVEYIETVCPRTLHPVQTVKQGTLIALAVQIGDVRLIDNLVV